MSKKVVLFVGIGCGGVVFMFAACAGVLFWGWRSASTAGGEISMAIDELLNAAAQGDLAKTYPSATTPDFRQITSESQYADLGKMIKAHLGSLQSKNLTTINLRQLNAVTQADVIYQAIFARGRATIHATLRRGDGRWLLQSLRVDSPALLKAVADVPCPHCGEMNVKTARFCAHCGKPLSSESAAEKPTAEAEEPAASVAPEETKPSPAEAETDPAA